MKKKFQKCLWLGLLSTLLIGGTEQVGAFEIRIEDICPVSKERITTLTNLSLYKKALAAKRAGTANRMQRERLDQVEAWRQIRRTGNCRPAL